jgi:hypothetical protein
MEDYTLIVGNNTMTQPGFAIKWGNLPSLNETMGSPSNSTFAPATMQYIAFGVNWTMDIKQIYYEGQAVDSVALSVTNLTVTSPNVTGPADPPNVLSDLEWLLSRWYYFAIVAGIICLLAAISFRNAAIIAIGLLLLAAGGIGYYVAGDFSLLDC